jgi:hypothetical protein
MKQALLGMKQILLPGLILISSILYESCNRKDRCEQNTPVNLYTKISQQYSDSFKLDTLKKMSFKKYKNDSVIVFTYQSRNNSFIITGVNATAEPCTTYYQLYQKDVYTYANEQNEPLIITQTAGNASLFFRNKQFSFSNSDISNKKSTFDSITLSGNMFYHVLQSLKPYDAYTDYSALYSYEYGFIRMRLSPDDVWDLQP